MAIDNPDSSNNLYGFGSGDIPYDATLYPGADRPYGDAAVHQPEVPAFLPMASTGDRPGDRHPGSADDAAALPLEPPALPAEAKVSAKVDGSHEGSEQPEQTRIVDPRERLTVIVGQTTEQLDEYRARHVARQAMVSNLSKRAEQLGPLTKDNQREWNEITTELFALREEAESDSDGRMHVLPDGRARVWDAASEEGVVHEGVVSEPAYLEAALKLSPQKDEYESPAERKARVAAIMDLSSRITPDEPALVVYVNRGLAMYSVAAAGEHPGGFTFALASYDTFGNSFAIGVGDRPSIDMGTVAVAMPDEFLDEEGHATVYTSVHISVDVGEEEVAVRLTADCNAFAADAQAWSAAVARGREEGDVSEDDLERSDRWRTFAAMNLLNGLTAAERAKVSLDLGEGRVAAIETLQEHYAKIGAGPLSEQPAERMEKVGSALRQLHPGITDEAFRDYMVGLVRERMTAGEETRFIPAARSIARLTNGNYETIYKLLRAGQSE